VEVQAEGDTLVECLLWLLGSVDIDDFFRLQISMFMIHHSVNDTVTNSLDKTLDFIDSLQKITFEIMYSASSSLSKCNLRQMSRSEIRE
jgi:hypothetical protein